MVEHFLSGTSFHNLRPKLSARFKDFGSDSITNLEPKLWKLVPEIVV